MARRRWLICGAGAAALFALGVAVWARPTRAQVATVPSVDVAAPAAVPSPAPPPPEASPPRDEIIASAALDTIKEWVGNGYNYSDPRLHGVANALRGRFSASLAHWRLHRDEPYVGSAMARAISLAVQPDDQAAVIAALPEATWLIANVTTPEQAQAALPQLRARLADEELKLPREEREWVLCFADAATIADVPLLSRVLLRLKDGAVQAEMVDHLQRLPRTDLDAAVTAAWGARAPSEYYDQQRGFVQCAAAAGIRDAFVGCGAVLAGGQLLPDQKRRLRAWFATQPAFAGAQPSVTWFTEHGAQAQFRDGRWELPAPDAVPAPGPATTPLAAPSPHLPDAIPDGPVPPPPAGLSADSDATTVAAWIDQQAATVLGMKQYSLKDPLIDRLAAVPPARFNELVLALKRHRMSGAMTSFLQAALVRMTRQEHREQVLALLPDHSFLVEAVIAKQWHVAAAPGLRAILAGKTWDNYQMIVHAVEALVSLGDPADHALLRDALCRMRYGYWQEPMARALARMPGFDLRSAVRAAWGRLGRGDYGDRQDGFAVVAAEQGIAEALPIVIAHATGGKTAFTTRRLAEQARQFCATNFNLPPNAEAIAAWWVVAQDQVRWDEAAGRWSGPAPDAVKRPEPANSNF